MLKLASDHVRNCHARAAACREKAEAAGDPEKRAFWREQEQRWLKLADSNDLSARISLFLDTREGETFSPEAENGVATLVDVFNRVCASLNLDLSDEVLPRKIAHSIIVSAIDGESDPEALYQGALRAASH